ncbi:hypothetical protein R3P38DRAFT_2920621 [Favolaschia claudopus]|uniref:F-box domain-containing protein n=1 Tax=Favolaschia claudopus TaxID=2862362 RepID=A0AAW0C354_9AGAR
MSRRSARLHGLKQRIVDGESQSDSTSHDEEHEDTQEDDFEEPRLPPRKRRKVVNNILNHKTTVVAADSDQKSKRVRGRRGILSSLREFPLDLIAEIFGHLNPGDLLNLARTSKEIRVILMSKSSAFIWRDARSQVEGLPDLPPDLSEPEFANLCFSGHCHKCLTTPVPTIIWSVRQRLCKKCIATSFGSLSSLTATTKLDTSVLSAIVPSYCETRRGRRYYYEHTSYWLDIGSKLVEECANFMENGIVKRSDPGFSEWYKKRSEELKEIKQHAESCATWAANRSNERKDKLDDSRKLRQEAIIEHLTALGWGEEIPFHIEQLATHKLVKQPKELTNRIWKNIEAPLVEFITTLKEERLTFARTKIISERQLLAAKVYTDFVASSPRNDIFPPKVDVLSTEPFRSVIEDTPVHPEEKITEESFNVALVSVPQFAAAWRQRKDEELVLIMQKIRPHFNADHLRLATTFFTCGSDLVSYPRILVHDAATRYRYSADYPSLQATLQSEIWNAGDRVKYLERVELNAQSVVRACGLDPDVTTRCEMDEINPAFECLNCVNETSRLLMRWNQAMNHQCSHNYDQPAPQPYWKCLNVEEERLLEAEEKIILESDGFGYLKWHDLYCCKACGNGRKMTTMNLKAHLQSEHNISDEVSFDHFEYHPDTGISDRYPMAVRLKVVKEVESKAAESDVAGTSVV